MSLGSEKSIAEIHWQNRTAINEALAELIDKYLPEANGVEVFCGFENYTYTGYETDKHAMVIEKGVLKDGCIWAYIDIDGASWKITLPVKEMNWTAADGLAWEPETFAESIAKAALDASTNRKAKALA